MKKNKYILGLLAVMLSASSCLDLTEINDDPTGLSKVGGHTLLSTVLSSTAGNYTSENYTNTRIGAAVQHFQKIDGAGDNTYFWGTGDWATFYDVLRNDMKMLETAQADGNNFYYGVGMVMKAFIYGYVSDIWGDCPYTEAVQGDKNIMRPKYDPQETVYKGILQDLEHANEALAKGLPSTYSSSTEGPYDLAYNGDIAKWRKMANSLALRYYMRLSVKLPDFAKAGVEKIMGNPTLYPIFSGTSDNCRIAYPGANKWDSWPGGTLNWPDGDNFRRRRPCSTLIDKLGELNDPRQAVWFTPVQTQIVIDDAPYEYPAEDYTVKAPAGYLADSLRYVHDNAAILKTNPYDTKAYVGLMPCFPETYRFEYNLTKMDNDAKNRSLSYFAPMFQQNANALVKSTLISYAEVCFILSEAALKGWNVGGTAEDYYQKGVTGALAEYNAAANFNTYYAQSKVAYNGTLERIMEQKWIASFLQPQQAWFDWRRTGFPDFQLNKYAQKPETPLRYKYQAEESRNNLANYNEALKRLEKTQYSDNGEDDEYSKMWVIQGTGKPW